MKDIFLISPVRNIPTETKAAIAEYVAQIERNGKTVYVPLYDTHQENDPTGLRICRDNREAIWNASAVQIWYDRTSRGSIFDLGMTFAFMREKKYEFSIANPFPYLSDLNSAMSGHTARLCYEIDSVALDINHIDTQQVTRIREGLFRSHGLSLVMDPADDGSLFTFGMVFAMMRNHPKHVLVSNLLELPQTKEKSFNNLVHAFDALTRPAATTI